MEQRKEKIHSMLRRRLQLTNLDQVAMQMIQRPSNKRALLDLETNINRRPRLHLDQENTIFRTPNPNLLLVMQKLETKSDLTYGIKRKKRMPLGQQTLASHIHHSGPQKELLWGRNTKRSRIKLLARDSTRPKIQAATDSLDPSLLRRRKTFGKRKPKMKSQVLETTQQTLTPLARVKVSQ